LKAAQPSSMLTICFLGLAASSNSSWVSSGAERGVGDQCTLESLDVDSTIDGVWPLVGSSILSSGWEGFET